MVEAIWVADTQLQLSQLSCLDADLHKDQRRQSSSSPEASVDAADSKGQAGLGSQLGSQAQPVEICHDITLSRGCLIAGLPLILSERVEHHYKSMGWSLFYEIT